MLSDTIRHIDLSVWPEAALVLFVGVFVMVSLRTLRAGRGFEREMASAALDDGAPVAVHIQKKEHAHG
ncbi:MAG: hypothetical protein ACIAQU_03355 [Phycisphaerales bacterium JB064]